MKDKLERYIAENRDQFDREIPDPEIWKKVERNIRPEPSFKWGRLLLRAAGVAAIFALSFMASEFIHRQRNEGLRSDRSSGREKDVLIPELQEAEAYYTGIINAKLEELKPIMLSCPSLEEDLMTDFTELDSISQELKMDLRDNIANEEVIQAIIDNYRMKIEILEMMMEELDPESDFCIPNAQDYEL